jgi:hypothetical protein
MPEVTLISKAIKQGEGKWFKFTYTADGAVMDLSKATFFFAIKKTIDDEEYVHTVEDDDEGMDKDNAATGIVRVNIPASVTADMDPGDYLAEIQCVLNADTDVDNSQQVKFKIEKPIIEPV